MNRMRNTNQSKFKSILQWATANRTRSAALVFMFIVITGSSASLINKMFEGEVKSASIVQDMINIREIPGWWYNENFGVSVCETDSCDQDSDPDKDKLSNYQEYYYSSDPNNSDTNANGNTDGEDVAFGFVPNKPGKVTFEEAGSDENILGESLAYNTEVKNIIVGMIDFSKTLTPEISDAELQIIDESNKDNFVTYILAMNEVSNKYSESIIMAEGLDEAIKQQNEDAINQIEATSLSILEDFRKIPVPRDAVQLHKYHLALWKLIPTIVKLPAPDTAMSIESVYSEEINNWYDSVQAMISLNQKILPEMQSLRNKYSY